MSKIKKKIKRLEEEIKQLYQWAEWHTEKIHGYKNKLKAHTTENCLDV